MSKVVLTPHEEILISDAGFGGLAERGVILSSKILDPNIDVPLVVCMALAIQNNDQSRDGAARMAAVLESLQYNAYGFSIDKMIASLELEGDVMKEGYLKRLISIAASVKAMKPLAALGE